MPVLNHIYIYIYSTYIVIGWPAAGFGWFVVCLVGNNFLSFRFCILKHVMGLCYYLLYYVDYHSSWHFPSILHYFQMCLLSFLLFGSVGFVQSVLGYSPRAFWFLVV